MKERVPSASRRMVSWLSRGVEVGEGTSVDADADGDGSRNGSDRSDESNRGDGLPGLSSPDAIGPGVPDAPLSPTASPSDALAGAASEERRPLLSRDDVAGQYGEVRPLGAPSSGGDVLPPTPPGASEPRATSTRAGSGRGLGSSPLTPAEAGTPAGGQPRIAPGQDCVEEPEPGESGHLAAGDCSFEEGAASQSTALLGRLQLAFKHLAVEATLAATTSLRRRLRSDLPQASEHGRSSAHASFSPGETPTTGTRGPRQAVPGVHAEGEGYLPRADPVGPTWRGARGGVPAWGPGSLDEADALLPPPASTLPPRLLWPESRRRDEAGVSKTRDGTGGSVGSGWRAEDSRWSKPSTGTANEGDVGKGSGGGGGGGHAGDGGRGGVSDPASPTDPAALEWPSLLGAMGSKTPASPSPPLSPSPSACEPSPSLPPGSPTTPADAADASDPSGYRRRREGSTEAVPTPPATPAAHQSFSSPRSTPVVPSSALPPPSLPPTCYGVGVEVAGRLRERAWLAGKRSWEDEEPGRGGGGRGRRLGHGFDPESVGGVFPLDMVLQVGGRCRWVGAASCRCRPWSGTGGWVMPSLGCAGGARRERDLFLRGPRGGGFGSSVERARGPSVAFGSGRSPGDPGSRWMGVARLSRATEARVCVLWFVRVEVVGGIAACV